MTPDEQEALSRKYSRSLSILALESGSYALFLPFSNESGMPLARIGTWAELEPIVRAFDPTPPESVRKRRTQDEINLDELFDQTENTDG